MVGKELVGPAIGDGTLRKIALEISVIEIGGDSHLSQLIDAGNPTGGFLGPTQRRKKHAGQNGDDGDNHQQLDQGERPDMAVSTGSPVTPVGWTIVGRSVHKRLGVRVHEYFSFVVRDS